MSTHGPVKGFVRPSYVFALVKVSYILTTCRYFDNFEFDILMQVVFSATLPRRLVLSNPVRIRILCA